MVTGSHPVRLCKPISLEQVEWSQVESLESIGAMQPCDEESAGTADAQGKSYSRQKSTVVYLSGPEGMVISFESDPLC
jgi:hypothetical protein